MSKRKYPRAFKDWIKSGAEFEPNENSPCFGFETKDKLCPDIEDCDSCKLATTYTNGLDKVRAKIAKWRPKGTL